MVKRLLSYIATLFIKYLHSFATTNNYESIHFLA